MKSAIETLVHTAEYALKWSDLDPLVDPARAELAELLEYAEHKPHCDKIGDRAECWKRPCTCGLEQFLERFKGGE